MTAKESKAVGYVCQDGSVTFYMDGSFNLQPPAGTELVPESALHAAEVAYVELQEENAASEAIWSRKCDELDAELGELRRRVGSLIERLRPDIECAPWVIAELKLLASDGGAGGDNEGEGK